MALSFEQLDSPTGCKLKRRGGMIDERENATRSMEVPSTGKQDPPATLKYLGPKKSAHGLPGTPSS